MDRYVEEQVFQDWPVVKRLISHVLVWTKNPLNQSHVWRPSCHQKMPKEKSKHSLPSPAPKKRHPSIFQPSHSIPYSYIYIAHPPLLFSLFPIESGALKGETQGWPAPLRDHHWAASYRIISISRLGTQQGANGKGRLDKFGGGSKLRMKFFGVDGFGGGLGYDIYLYIYLFGDALTLGPSFIYMFLVGTGIQVQLHRQTSSSKLEIIIPIPLHSSRTPTSSCSSFTPKKTNMDTQNSHIWKEIHFKNHNSWYLC